MAQNHHLNLPEHLPPFLSNDVTTSLTVRLLMHGKEVGSIIGKKGEIVKRFREESGAKINISDSSSSERVVSVSGTSDAIYKAFILICQKNEEALLYQSAANGGVVGGTRPAVSLRLVVPASQCGSLIGKGGTKIKEIRELSGATIQVSSEMLAGSTERTVTVSGSGESVTQCVLLVCNVMAESPPKGATVPYRPRPQINTAAATMMYTGGAALPTGAAPGSGAPQTFGLAPAGFTLSPCGGGVGGGGVGGGGTAAEVSVSGSVMPVMVGATSASSSSGQTSPPLMPPHTGLHLTPPHLIDAKSGHILMPGLPSVLPDMAKGMHLANIMAGVSGLAGHPAAMQTNHNAMSVLSAHLRGGHAMLLPSPISQISAAAAAASAVSHSQELTVPNELIGCIIGKGGTKIAEIRQLTGAMITISKFDDTSEDCTHQDRVITIKGTGDQIALAQYLINTRISLETASMGVAGMGFQYISPTHIIKVPIH